MDYVKLEVGPKLKLVSFDGDQAVGAGKVRLGKEGEEAMKRLVLAPPALENEWASQIVNATFTPASP